MQFLSPWTALLAAALAIPLLLLLYFLKLRRQTLRIPSTLLWRRSFEDLQVNAPFQRLRWSLLLLLQLLMLAALLLALAEPLWRAAGGTNAARVVLLIDRSASMSAPVAAGTAADHSAPPPTRFEAARRQARDIIDSLGEGGRAGPSQIMLIAFGSTAQVVSGFESNRGVLREALDSITPTDEQADLESALELASAFAGSRDEDALSERPPQVLLLSDGNVAATGDRTTYSLRSGEFKFRQVARDADSPDGAGDDQAVGDMIDNLGIVALGARRDYDDPARVIVFARLLNAGPRPLEPIITVLVDGRPATTVRASVPAAATLADGTAGNPGEASISHALDLPGGAVIALQHNHHDQLASDDIAAIVVPPPSKPRIALVFPADDKPDPYLYELFQALEPESVQTFSAVAWSQIEPASIDDGSRFDLVVFDRIDGARLPGVPSITFGGVPAGVRAHGASSGEGGRPILSWDRQHPIMRNLSLDSIVYSGFGEFDLPEATATTLAWGPDGPIIALLRTRGARHVTVGFAPGKSNWPLHVSSAMFVQNAMEYLLLATGPAGSSSAAAGGTGGLVYRPGEPITVRAAAGAKVLTIEGGGAKMELPVPASDVASGTAPAPRLVSVPAISRAGLYAARGVQPPHEFLAVSVLSDVESDIRPRDQIVVNAQASEARAGTRERPLPLWPWLLAAAFVLAVLEWLAYCRRVR